MGKATADATMMKGSPASVFHVSEEADIARFDPRAAPALARPVVWAVNDQRLRNYLLPRDCPRVTFFAGLKTSAPDRDRFLGTSSAVVAVESTWLARIRGTRLFCYELPGASFQCVDVCAGYFHCFDPVVPTGVKVIDDPLAALTERGVEIRIMPSLWALHDAVLASTLSYSIIRMRNAADRAADQSPIPSSACK